MSIYITREIMPLEFDLLLKLERADNPEFARQELQEVRSQLQELTVDEEPTAAAALVVDLVAEIVSAMDAALGS